jgi:hypothetical protein
VSKNTAVKQPEFPVGSVQLFSISFVGQLDSGEKLTGTPLVTEQTTSDLTITNKVVSTAALVIDGQTVAIGKAVQCLVSGFQVANSPYTIKVQCDTDSSPAQTKIGYGVFAVEA